MNRRELVLPSFYAGYLINGDIQGLTPKEENELKRLEMLYGPCSGTLEDEPFFKHGHALNINEGADCYTFIFLDHTPDEPTTDGRGNQYNSEGLRYVSPEVGWVDQDEEYY